VVGVDGGSLCLLFSELSFGVVQFVSMSQSDRLELFFFLLLCLFFSVVVGRCCFIMPILGSSSF
jgi:hypothetical protein